MLSPTSTNRYQVTSMLGKGAMGVVYRATDRQTLQEVALKVIASDLAPDADLLERFRREGEALRALRHRNIVAFVDNFVYQGHQVIVMEYVPGGNLHHLIRQGPLPLDRAREIALDLCDALTSAHRLNIIHRDIKPENVLLTEEGAPKLTDFGLARLASEKTRLTGSGIIMGTPDYMSPEAWEGRPLDAQADIWSLGVMLFEMLTGELPFRGDTIVTVMNRILTAPLPDVRSLRPEVSPALAEIVRHMLQRDPVERYRTMRQVGVDLEEIDPCVSPAELEAEAAALFPSAEAQPESPAWFEAEAIPAAPAPEPSQPAQELPPAPPEPAANAPSAATAAPKASPDQPKPEARALANRPLIWGVAAAVVLICLLVIVGLGWKALGTFLAPVATLPPTVTFAPTLPVRTGVPPPTAGGATTAGGASTVGAPLVVGSVQALPTDTRPPATPTATPTRKPPPSPTATATRRPTPATPPTLALGATQVSDKDGMTLVYVPAGKFYMGAPDTDTEATASEKPAHAVYLDAYWIDQTDVTNAMFGKFVQALGYQTDAEKGGSGGVYNPASKQWESVQGADWQHPQGPTSNLQGLGQHPVVQVSWADAKAYCNWAGRQLPSEAQWEKAARGTDGRKFPWGNAPVAGNLLNLADKNVNIAGANPAIDDGYQFTAPVGHYPAGASPYGALDMAGNVWQWVADWFTDNYYTISPSLNPLGPTGGQYRLLRGGSWGRPAKFARVVSRLTNIPNRWASELGFRCARLP